MSQSETPVLIHSRFNRFTPGIPIALTITEGLGGFMNWVKMSLIILLSLSGFVACNKNEGGGNSSRNPIGTNSTNFNMTTGSVSGTYNVTQEVQNFLATNTFDVNQISQVNQTNGIQFSGVARFDSNNNLIANQSYINIRINFTDTANTQQSTTLGIQGVSGNVSYSGYIDARAQIRFEDQYGYVIWLCCNGWFIQPN
jgi:hypothetical protein